MRLPSAYFLALSILPSLTLAQPTVPPSPYQSLPLPARITGWGYLGDEAMINGDGMLPFYGNQNQIFYVDVQAKTAFDSDWLGSVGLGGRSVYNDNAILGAYVFVDRNVSLQDNEFWFVSPGIEALGTLFDFRANAYIPTSSKRQYGSTDWADNFGVDDFVTFQGHNQFDIMMTQDEEVGWGADAEVGMRVPGLRGTRAYVGGYHFNFQDASDINGVAGRIELPVNRYLGFTARDSYDNIQHNTFLVGIKLTIGGVNTQPRDEHQPIQQRLLDPIERNLATLGQGVGEPVQDVLTPVSNGPAPTPELERSNIWFFSPTATGTFDGSLAACTIENPCINTDFTQATINGINTLVASSSNIDTTMNSTSPSFYLAPGTYSSLNGEDPLEFTNDWLFGRSENFASAQQSALLVGGMSFFGTNNLLDHIILLNSTVFPQVTGITVNPRAELTLVTTQVGVFPLDGGADIAANNFTRGIFMNGSTLNVEAGSEIYALENDGLAQALGIASSDALGIGNTLNISNSTIIAAGLSDFTNSAIGISLSGATIALNVSGSRIQAVASGEGSQRARAISLSSDQTTTAIIQNSQLDSTATATGVDAEVLSTGLSSNTDSGLNSLTLIDSSIRSSGVGGTKGSAFVNGISMSSTEGDNLLRIQTSPTGFGESITAEATMDGDSTLEVKAISLEANNPSGQSGSNIVQIQGGNGLVISAQATVNGRGNASSTGINMNSESFSLADNLHGNNSLEISGDVTIESSSHADSGTGVFARGIDMSTESEEGTSGNNTVITTDGSMIGISASAMMNAGMTVGDQVGAAGIFAVTQSSNGNGGNNTIDLQDQGFISSSATMGNAIGSATSFGIIALSNGGMGGVAGINTFSSSEEYSITSQATGGGSQNGIGIFGQAFGGSNINNYMGSFTVNPGPDTEFLSLMQLSLPESSESN